MHPYETISLSNAGYVLAAWLILSHLWMLLKPDNAIAFLQKFPRNTFIGALFMAFGMLWFWLLVAPLGIPLEMDLGEFNGAKKILLIIIPAAAFLMITEVKEFLAVRGLGVICLMSAAPLLGAAFQEPAMGKLLIPIFAYAMLTAGLFFIGTPYLMRDGIKIATASKRRFQALAAGGLIYGIATLACAILWY